MKIKGILAGIVSFSIVFASLLSFSTGSAEANTSVFYDFNTPGSLTNSFNSYISSGVAQESETGGISNSGAINAPSTADAVFATKSSYSIGPVGSNYTFTAFMQSVGNSGYSGVGFTSHIPAADKATGTPYRPIDALGISVHGGGFVFHNGAADFSGSWNLDNQNISSIKKSTLDNLLNAGSPDKWYKIVFKITRDTSTTFDTRVEVWPANADGTLIRPDEADAIFELRDKENAALLAAPAIYSYINFSGDRVRYFDNYQVQLSGGASVIEPGLPVVVTDSVTKSGRTVTVNGAVTSDQGSAITERGFVYATTAGATTSNSKVAVSGTTGSFTGSTATLDPGTYYFRAFAANANGTSYGSETEVSVTLPTSIPDAGFESNSISTWTTSTPAISFNPTITAEGQGAGTIGGNVTFQAGSYNQVTTVKGVCAPAVDAATWVFGPSGTTAGALQPSYDSPTFDSMTTSLGLSNSDNSAIKGVISTQASQGNCGGSAVPENAAWMKKEFTLTAGTTYRMAWNYIGTDYAPYNDGSITTLVYKGAGTPTININNQSQNYALLGFTNPGTGDYSTGSFGSTGWQYAIYEVSLTGTYELGFASFNIGDDLLSPLLLIDDNLGTVTKNGVAFGAVAPNNPNAPVTETTPTNTAPGAPTIDSVTTGSGQLQINFTAPASDGGAAITNYKYSTDGINYLALNPATTTSPITISFLSSNGTTPLSNGTTYPITLKAVNSIGDSAASSPANGTPAAPTPVVVDDGAWRLQPTPSPTPTPTPTRTPLATPTIQSTPPTNPLPSPSPTPTSQSTPQSGSPFNPAPLVQRAIEEIVDTLKPVAFDVLVNLITKAIDELRSGTQNSLVLLLDEETAKRLVNSTNSIVLNTLTAVLKNGVAEPARIVVVDITQLQVVAGEGGLLSLVAKEGEDSVPVDSQGRLQMILGNSVEAEGTGFRANTEFAVWLFSDPTLLGVGKTDAAGRFFASFPVEKEIPTGDHTLQVVGTASTGEQRSIALPVIVITDKETALANSIDNVIQVSQNPVQKWFDSLNYLAILMFLVIFLALWMLWIMRRRKDEEEEIDLANAALNDSFVAPRPSFEKEAVAAAAVASNKSKPASSIASKKVSSPAKKRVTSTAKTPKKKISEKK
jgi:hypothetical protein